MSEVRSQEPRGKLFSGRALLVTIAACCAVVGLLAWRATADHASHAIVSEEPQSESEAHPTEKPLELSVEVAKPIAHGLGRESRQPGTVHVFEAAELFAKVSGYLVEQTVDIGSHVKQGELLARLDVPEAEADVEEASAALERARSVVVQRQAQLQTSKAEADAAQAKIPEMEAEIQRAVAQTKLRTKEYKRIKELNELHSIEEQIVDEKQDAMEVAIAAQRAADAALTSARAQVVAANARVVQAQSDITHAESDVKVSEAKLEKSKVLLDYTKITSPYDGVVTFRGFHRGEFITARDQGATKPLLTVARTDPMRVVVKVADLDVPYVTVGDRADVKIQALPGKVFSGKVSRMADSEEHESRTMRVEIDLPNPNGVLREGMYGGTVIYLEPPSDALTVPSTALVGKTTDSHGSVWVVRDGKAHLVPVTIGQDDGLHMEITSGLTAKDDVVVSFRGPIQEGARIADLRTASTR